ncbi:MAG: hypothetical protein ACI85I_002632 [Arenicella sp.]|jgi:hypothetical protein
MRRKDGSKKRTNYDVQFKILADRYAYYTLPKIVARQKIGVAFMTSF